MKSSIITFLLCIGISGALLPGCDTPAENVGDAKEDLAKAQEKLAEAREDSLKTANWEAFKSASEDQIAINDVNIAELKSRKGPKGESMDPKYIEQVNILEARNKALKERIDFYEKYNSNWEEFKREFNHDLEELSKTMKEITVDNKK
jgi:hypothetical protein